MDTLPYEPGEPVPMSEGPIEIEANRGQKNQSVICHQGFLKEQIRMFLKVLKVNTFQKTLPI